SVMSRKFLCRHCGLGVSSAFSARQPFAISGARPHYAPDLPFRTEHIRIDVDVDPQGKTLSGTVSQKLKAVAADQKSIRMDQIGLQIGEVHVNQVSAEFSIEGHS